MLTLIATVRVNERLPKDYRITFRLSSLRYGKTVKGRMMSTSLVDQRPAKSYHSVEINGDRKMCKVFLGKLN